MTVKRLKVVLLLGPGVSGSVKDLNEFKKAEI